MVLSPAPTSSRSSASPKMRAASGWMMSTDCSRSNGTRLEFLNTAPVSIRSSSSSMTKRVKYQLTNPASRGEQDDPADDRQQRAAGRRRRSRHPLPSGTSCARPVEDDRDQHDPAADERGQRVRALGLLDHRGARHDGRRRRGMPGSTRCGTGAVAAGSVRSAAAHSPEACASPSSVSRSRSRAASSGGRPGMVALVSGAGGDQARRWPARTRAPAGPEATSTSCIRPYGTAIRRAEQHAVGDVEVVLALDVAPGPLGALDQDPAERRR